MVRQTPPKKPPIVKSEIPDDAIDDEVEEDHRSQSEIKDDEAPRAANPPAAEKPKKLKLNRTSATKCIYFRDAQQLAELDALSRVYPTGSVSGLIQQLVGALLDANSKAGNTDRTVKLNNIIIYL